MRLRDAETVFGKSWAEWTFEEREEFVRDLSRLDLAQDVADGSRVSSFFGLSNPNQCSTQVWSALTETYGDLDMFIVRWGSLQALEREEMRLSHEFY